MANATANYGLVPYMNLQTGSTFFPSITCHTALLYGTALFIGDPVLLAGSGSPNNADPTVKIAIGSAGTESTNLFGVIVGVDATGPESLNSTHSLASTATTVQVVPFLPGYLFRINSNDDSSLSLNEIGLGFDLIAGAGDALTGRSGWALDDDASGTTGRQLRLIRFDDRPDNTWSTTLATVTADLDCIVAVAESFWIGDMAAGI